MDTKSTAPYPPPPPPPPLPPPPPPHSLTTRYPQPSSYGSPHPATSGIPNQPVEPPTKEIGFREVYTVEPNQEPAPVIVVHKHRAKWLECCWVFISLLSFIISIVCMLVVARRMWGIF